MTESANTPPPHPAPPKKHILDSAATKFLLGAVSFASPTPMAIVAVQLWLNLSNTEGEPMGYIRNAISGAGFFHLLPLIVSVLPATLLITLIFRTKKSRSIMLVMLFVAALAQFMVLSSMGTN